MMVRANVGIVSVYFVLSASAVAFGQASNKTPAPAQQMGKSNILFLMADAWSSPHAGKLAVLRTLLTTGSRAGGNPRVVKTKPKFDTRKLAGWTVHINTLLLVDHAKPTARALELLEAQLAEIVRVVPAAAVAKLHRVPLWISPEYPNTPPRAEYHPNARWLREHDRDPAMAKGIEFTNVRIFEAESRRMPNFSLHELAHAYHDRELARGFDNASIKAAYEKAQASGKYDRVERQDSEGRKTLDRAYAMTNPQEYFAESTEAYFTRNDFFPYTLGELQKHDPEMVKLLTQLWGVKGPAGASKRKTAAAPSIREAIGQGTPRSKVMGLAILFATAIAGDGNMPGLLEESLLKEDAAVLANAVRTEGNAARGAAIFFQPSLNCAKCHAVGEAKADAIGPDLSRLGREATETYLIESVLQPSKTVKKGFQTVAIATTDGAVLIGLLAEDRPDRVVIRDPSQSGKLVTILKKDIDQRTDGGQSVMPAGLLNGLNSRQQFLDLIRYLREIADGGPERARALAPDPSQVAGLKLPDYERTIDHAGMIGGLGAESLQRGEAIYTRVCANCHGTKAAPGSLPTSLRFASGQFKNGKDPYSIYQTLTHGFGQMPPQTWMVPAQKYDVIHYVRETYLKTDNPTQYAAVDRGYLDRLPKGSMRGPEPSKIEPWSAMDYGPTLTATYEVSDNGSNFAYKGVAVRLDAGPGGVSRGRYWSVFDHDTMRLAGSWTGDGFIDWNGINFNGRHEIHPKIVGLTELANPIGPGWANPVTGSFSDPRLRGRDGRPYGPLPRSWSHFRGQYRHGDRVVLSYTVGNTAVLEMPGIETGSSSPVFTRTFAIGPRDRAMVLQVARWPGRGARLKILTAANDTTSTVALLEPAPRSSPQPDQPHFQFDGNTYLDIPGSKAFDMGADDYTIAARVQTRRGGTLFAETVAGDTWVHDGKSLFIRDGRLVFDIGWVGAVVSGRRVNDGEWHELVMTYEGKSHLARLFIDGRRDAEKRLAPRKALANHVHRIGFTAPDFPEPDSYFHGEIADLRFFNRAITSDEVAGILKPNENDVRLVACWQPGSAQGGLVRDGSGHGLDARVVRDGTAVAENAGVLAAISPPTADATWSNTPEGDLRLTIPAGGKLLHFNLRVARVPKDVDAQALARSIKDGPAADLASLTRGGPPRWPEVLKSSITAGREDGPFAADTLGLPENNPWLCQMRLTGFDFLDGGHQAAVSTWDGDVWLVSGLDARSGELSWRRIASGLFQPLGVKIRDGNLFVACRDQIVILRDKNGDGETDFYENFNSDHQVTEHFHEFAMDLQTDTDGNFYYAKAARHGKTALVPQHGTLLRVSRDGLRTEILATGFRAPNGVCLNADGTFFLTDQEGHWIPKNRINHVKAGGFYGNMWGYHDVTDASDTAMQPPVCWITNDFDRSPAELVHVTSNAWGPLKGSLLNLSYGNGKVFVVPHETVANVMQGGMCALPIESLPSGVMRGRFHPKDGQLYCCGMFAWAGNQTAPGGFYRLRTTGQPMFLPTGLHATRNGMQITFTQPIDCASASDPSHYSVKTWSLKRTTNYGSKHYDEKPLRVSAAALSDDARTVFLTLPEIQPTWGMEIQFRLKGAHGEPCVGTIHNTIHHLADSRPLPASDPAEKPRT